MPHHRHHHHRSRVPSGVADPHLIREDFKRLSNQVLRTTWHVEDMILVQSVEGHAHEGHGAFEGRRCVNTTINDIVQALGRSPHAVAAERQVLIDEINQWALKALEGNAPHLLINEENEPLLRIGFLRQQEVDPAQVLRGLYLGGVRDRSDVRAEVEEKYGIKMGGGQCYLVDRDYFEVADVHGESLARGEHQDDIARYREIGLIVADSGPEDFKENIRYMYIRHRRGSGASDDGALLAGGFLYNLDVAIGVFLADAIDTLEKYVPVYSDQDDDLAQLVIGRQPDQGITPDDLHAFVFLSGIPEESSEVTPDCSLRHFLRLDRNVDQTAIESHLQFIQGHPYAPQKIGKEKIPNELFYEDFTRRLKALRG